MVFEQQRTPRTKYGSPGHSHGRNLPELQNSGFSPPVSCSVKREALLFAAKTHRSRPKYIVRGLKDPRIRYLLFRNSFLRDRERSNASNSERVPRGTGRIANAPEWDMCVCISFAISLDRVIYPAVVLSSVSLRIDIREPLLRVPCGGCAGAVILGVVKLPWRTWPDFLVLLGGNQPTRRPM